MDDLLKYLFYIIKTYKLYKIFEKDNIIKCVLNNLSDTEKTFLLRLLGLNQAIKWNPFLIWFNENTPLTLKTLSNLKNCCVLSLEEGKDNEVKYKIHPIFEETFMKILNNNINKESFNEIKVNCSYEEHSNRQWNRLISWIVGGKMRYSNNVDNLNITSLSNVTETVLQSLNLTTKTKQNQTELSHEAFKWLLNDKCLQLAILVIGYLKNNCVEEDVVYEVLVLVFDIATTEIGTSFRLNTLSPIQQQFVTFANDIGLIYLDKVYFHTTKLAASLLSNKQKSDAVLVLEDCGFIVESNFKIYAFNPSDLLLSLLSYVTEIKILSPQLVVAQITRKAILSAYRAGTSSKQIIDFLTINAHHSLQIRLEKTGKPAVPADVITQLEMWENEKHRVKMTKVCLLEFNEELDIKLFPETVKKSKIGWWVYNTPLPSNENMDTWLNETKERIKRHQIGTLTQQDKINKVLSSTPILCIKPDFKNEAIQYIKQLKCQI